MTFNELLLSIGWMTTFFVAAWLVLHARLDLVRVRASVADYERKLSGILSARVGVLSDLRKLLDLAEAKVASLQAEARTMADEFMRFSNDQNERFNRVVDISYALVAQRDRYKRELDAVILDAVIVAYKSLPELDAAIRAWKTGTTDDFSRKMRALVEAHENSKATEQKPEP